MHHAVQMADYFSMHPAVQIVGLTGSLARAEDRAAAHDIDLVLLHDGSLPSGFFSILRGEMLAYSRYGILPQWELGEGANILFTLFGIRYHPIRRYIEENIPCKVDFICADLMVLKECSALDGLSRRETTPGISRRIFCEIPLLRFDIRAGVFCGLTRHRDGSCCRPNVSWEDVKQSRGHDPSGTFNIISVR